MPFLLFGKTIEASCAAIERDDCALPWINNLDNIATGSMANTSGQFRVISNYAGGCFNIYF
jgi:hypothetical protein